MHGREVEGLICNFRHFTRLQCEAQTRTLIEVSRWHRNQKQEPEKQPEEKPSVMCLFKSQCLVFYILNICFFLGESHMHKQGHFPHQILHVGSVKGKIFCELGHCPVLVYSIISPIGKSVQHFSPKQPQQPEIIDSGNYSSCPPVLLAMNQS